MSDSPSKGVSLLIRDSIATIVLDQQRTHNALQLKTWLELPALLLFRPAYLPDEAAHAITSEEGRSAILFGPERSGLTNEELDLCHSVLYIPANPDYSSLNLAAAVQIVAWEIRMAQQLPWPEPAVESRPATPQEMELLYEHLERVLVASGFMDPAQPRHLMRRMRRLFNRARLDENELNILRGLLAALAPGSGERDWAG